MTRASASAERATSGHNRRPRVCGCGAHTFRTRAIAAARASDDPWRRDALAFHARMVSTASKVGTAVLARRRAADGRRALRDAAGTEDEGELDVRPPPSDSEDRERVLASASARVRARSRMCTQRSSWAASASPASGCATGGSEEASSSLDEAQRNTIGAKSNRSVDRAGSADGTRTRHRSDQPMSSAVQFCTASSASLSTVPSSDSAL